MGKTVKDRKHRIKETNKFNYVGCVISDNNTCDIAIERRMRKYTFPKLIIEN